MISYTLNLYNVINYISRKLENKKPPRLELQESLHHHQHSHLNGETIPKIFLSRHDAIVRERKLLVTLFSLFCFGALWI